MELSYFLSLNAAQGKRATDAARGGCSVEIFVVEGVVVVVVGLVVLPP
jgi:predicted Kef-type K+ transport protein